MLKVEGRLAIPDILLTMVALFKSLIQKKEIDMIIHISEELPKDLRATFNAVVNEENRQKIKIIILDTSYALCIKKNFRRAC